MLGSVLDIEDTVVNKTKVVALQEFTRQGNAQNY